MNLKTVLITTLAFSLGACSFQKDSEKDKGTPSNVMEQIQKEREKQAFNGQLNESNVRVTFTDSRMGFYQMHVQWPQGISKVQLNIDGVREIVSYGGNRSVTVEHSSKHSISIEAYDDFGALISIYETSVYAPKDLIIAEDLNLDKNEFYEVRRAYFLAGSKIRTNGYHLGITADLLLVDESKSKDETTFIHSSNISTVTPGNTLKSVEQVLNSTITINAKKAVGTLRVALIGANGKDGRSGAELEREKGISRDIDPQLAGAKGADEIAGIGQSGDGRRERERRKPAQSGQNGKRGHDGHPGEDGQNGGSTGSLIVMVEDHSDFALEVATLPGAPGRGGEGAPGHPGGLGGAPGNFNSGICAESSKARAGSQGPNGSDGTRGKDGQQGKVGTIESNVANQKAFDLSLRGF